MRALSCDIVRDELPALAAGRLRPGEARRIGTHVARCEECRAELDMLRLLGRHPVAVPPGLDGRVLRRMDQRLRLRRWAPRPLAVAAATAVAILGGRFLITRTGERPIAIERQVVLPVHGGDVFQPFSGWPETDGLLASGVALDGLSNEELELLLTELDS